MKIYIKCNIYKPTMHGCETILLENGIHEATLTDDGEYAQIIGTRYSVHKSIFDILPETPLPKTQ